MVDIDCGGSVKAKVICGTFLAIVAIIVGLVASSLKKLNTEEAGLQYDVHMHSLKEHVYEAGLHLGPPGYRFIIFPRVYRTLAFEKIQCLNKDGLQIVLSVEFQYLASLSGSNLKSLIMEFEGYDRYRMVVADTAEEVIHDACSLFNVTQFQTSRVDFQERILSLLNTRLSTALHTNVRDVQVSNIMRPHDYEIVVRDKESAKQNIQVALQERPRVLTAARTKKMEAVTQASITMNKARTDARITITKAQAEAQAILNSFTTEAETYYQIQVNQQLNTTGLLSYLMIRAIQSASKPVNINVESPAMTKFP